MASAVKLMDAWIPSLIEAGSLLVMNATSDRDTGGMNCGILHCPYCGQLAVITETQMQGQEMITCGGQNCPARFFLRDGQTVPIAAMGEETKQ